MVSPMASICDPYATKCTKAEPKILQVKRGQKQRNAPDSARKRRNRVRSGCWREVQRVRTDGKTGIDRHRTCLGCRLGRFAAERHWRSLTPRHALRRGAAVPRCRVLMRANEKKRGKQMLVSLFWQGQKDLNPRHAVLETAALPTELYPYVKFCLIILSFSKVVVNGFFKIFLRVS